MLLFHFLLSPKRNASGFKRRAIFINHMKKPNVTSTSIKNQKKTLTAKMLHRKGVDLNATFNLVVVTKKNNLFLVLRDLNGRIIQHTSSGLNGFKNSNKSRPAAFESTIINFFQILAKINIKKLIIIFKGLSSLKHKIFHTLKLDFIKEKLNIKGLVVVDSAPHNGCRLQKAKRR